MITGVIKNKVDKIWTDIWAGGITNPITVIEQLTYLMFIRSLDEKELEAEEFENMGGGAMPQYPMMPAINPTVVSPFLYVTGNAQAYSRSPDNFDFDSSGIMTRAESIEKEGDRLLAHLLEVASGSMTKMETLDYAEQLELYMEGPVL